MRHCLQKTVSCYMMLGFMCDIYNASITAAAEHRLTARLSAVPYESDTLDKCIEAARLFKYSSTRRSRNRGRETCEWDHWIDSATVLPASTTTGHSSITELFSPTWNMPIHRFIKKYPNIKTPDKNTVCICQYNNKFLYIYCTFLLQLWHTNHQNTVQVKLLTHRGTLWKHVLLDP